MERLKYLKIKGIKLSPATYVQKSCCPQIRVVIRLCIIIYQCITLDKWKDTDAVETMVFFLDAVITEFLEKLERYKDSDDLDDQQTFLFMQRAYNFAKDNRALGLGVLGWHSYLQSKMLPFDSQEALIK